MEESLESVEFPEVFLNGVTALLNEGSNVPRETASMKKLPFPRSALGSICGSKAYILCNGATLTFHKKSV